MTSARNMPPQCQWNCGKGAHVTQTPSKKLRSHPLVLVSSNDSQIGPSIRHSLEQVGIKTTATTATEVVHTSNQIRPNLIVLDVAGFDAGFDVCHLLQVGGGNWRAPIIFVSNRGEVPSKVSALECGAVDYLTKPLDMQEVVARVRNHLRLQHALDNLAELQANQLRTLAGAQQSCMPQPGQIPDAHFSVALRQVHQAGGDFYDVIDLGCDQFDYIVADATGHDLSSTYWTLALKTLLMEYSSALFSPLDAMYLINRALLRILPEGVFFTALYLRLNRRTGRALLLSAGHTPAIWVQESHRNAPIIVRQQGDVLGAFSDATFCRVDLDVQKGDRLFMFSDGFLDCAKCESHRLERLAGALGDSIGESLQSVVSRVLERNFGNGHQLDDALLMGIEV